MHCRAEGAPGSRQSRARTASPCRSNAHPIRNKIQRSHPISAHSVHSRPPPEKTPGYIIHRPLFFCWGTFLFGRERKKRDGTPGGGFAAVRANDLPTGRGPPISSAKGKGRGRHIRAPKVPSRERILGGGRRVVTHKPRSTPPPACAQAPVPGQSSRRPATRCVRKAATGIPRHQRRPCHRRPSPPTEQTTPVEDPRRQLDEGMRRGDSGRQKSIRFRS